MISIVRRAPCTARPLNAQLASRGSAARGPRSASREVPGAPRPTWSCCSRHRRGQSPYRSERNKKAPPKRWCLDLQGRLLGGLGILRNRRQLGSRPPHECAEDRGGFGARATRDNDAHGLAWTLLLWRCLHI